MPKLAGSCNSRSRRRAACGVKRASSCLACGSWYALYKVPEGAQFLDNLRAIPPLSDDFAREEGIHDFLQIAGCHRRWGHASVVDGIMNHRPGPAQFGQVARFYLTEPGVQLLARRRTVLILLRFKQL
jgi:hypothetical protein